MKKRILPDAVPNEVSLSDVNEYDYLSVWFLSYCLLVGPSERFIVRSASKSMRSISNKTLQDKLKLCFFQEVKHAESHELFSCRYFKIHPILKTFFDFSSFFNYTILDKIAPHSLKLSIASAMEQLNSEIAYFGLNKVSSLNSDENFKDMLSWHFVEEIEHREVVFDLLKEVDTNRLSYILGILLGLFSFSFWITLGAALIMLARPITFFTGFFKSLGGNGILIRFIKSTIRYCKKDYHPSNEIIPPLFYEYQDKVKSYEASFRVTPESMV
ncbi:MAG: putative metal-dependent hydrolase [Crocinitomicaceae bacterium]|jgi:predicted metal-dependent hydrolase